MGTQGAVQPQGADARTVEIRCNWGLEDSLWLTAKAYGIVMENSQTSVAIEAKNGSLPLILTLIQVAYPIVRDLIKAVKTYEQNRNLAKAIIAEKAYRKS